MATKEQIYEGRLYTQREVEAIIQQEITKARIDELDNLYDHYSPYRPILDDDTQRSVRRYVSGRIAELSQALKESEERGSGGVV